jgi:UDP-glucose 4-epimerase
VKRVQLFKDNYKELLMGKTVLITGGAGYIGSHIAYYLACRGDHVIVIDKLVYGQHFEYPWATYIKGDCGDRKLLTHIFQTYPIEAVIHCAASIEVGESFKNPLAFYANNVGVTIQLLEMMQTYHIKNIIFSSICAVYGIPQSLPMAETHSVNPVSPYGMTKLMVESILKDAHTSHGLDYVVLRFFNAAGALPKENLGERHIPETHLIPLLLRSALQQKPFYIFGHHKPTHDGTCVRDFVHVCDIAYAHELALDYLCNGNRSDIFNLGTGIGYSVKQMIDAVEYVCDMPVSTIIADDRPGDPPVLIADAGKINTIMGWRARNSDLHHIIESAYVFEKMCNNLTRTPYIKNCVKKIEK